MITLSTEFFVVVFIGDAGGMYVFEMFVDNCEGFIVIIERKPRVYDTQFDTITNSDCYTALPSWSIIARNSIIRNIELKLTFKPCFAKSKNVNIMIFKKE